MKPLSMDLRERIVAAYEAGEGSYQKLAERFAVSKAEVGKLVRQARTLGTLEPQTSTRGRKRVIHGELESRLLEHLEEYPDATLEERIEALELDCCVDTMWNAIRRLGFRYKKNSLGNRTGTRRRGSTA